jgi:iron complex outermembrane receptor protein
MNHEATLLKVRSSRPLTRCWPGILSVCISLFVTTQPAQAQSDAAARLKEKDAQIANLLAEVERLKSALGQNQAPAPAPLTPPAAAARPAATTTAASTTEAGDDKDDLGLRMSAFEVRTTQGMGYSPGNSASALKTSESLMNLPAQIIVVTSDMIKDIGSNNASDVLSYAGLVPFYRGPAIMSRGSRVGNPYMDEVPQAVGIGVTDNTNVDSYQVIKGPQQALYPLASLGGLVLQTSKKPLAGRSQTSLDLKVQQWGRTTFTFDTNQPLATLGEAKFTYRLVGIAQNGQGPLYNSKDDRNGIYPSLAFDWRDTNVTLQYGILTYKYLPGGTGILTPDGGIYTGLGHRNQNSPPNNFDRNQMGDIRLSWTQRLSSTWQVKSQVYYMKVRRHGSTAFPTGVNWANNTMTYTVRRNSGDQYAFDVQTDVSGKYSIAGLPMTSAFGFNLHDQTGESKFLIASAASIPGFTGVTIPIGNANAINSIVLPPYHAYIDGPNPGTRTRQHVNNGYFMQTVDVIKDRLTLAAGTTYSYIETTTNTNLALRNPFVSTNSAETEMLHRYAIVGKITKDLSVYVSESTTFNPAVGTDFNNNPLPPVLGKSQEVGFKTSFRDGKYSFSLAAYKMDLTNQTVLAAFPAVNVAGLNYYIPIGDTVSKGWDASFAVSPVEGLQIVGTAYKGTVHDFNGNPIAATVENSWSLWSRYDFDRTGALKGLAFGGGAQKAGGKWFTTGGLTLPNGQAYPANSSGNRIFKLKQDVLVNLFTEYELNKNWTVRVDCANVLDEAYAIGAQGVGLADIVDPRTFSFRASYEF